MRSPPGSHHQELPTAKSIWLQNDTDDDLSQLSNLFRPQYGLNLHQNPHDLFGGRKGSGPMKIIPVN